MIFGFLNQQTVAQPCPALDQELMDDLDSAQRCFRWATEARLWPVVWPQNERRGATVRGARSMDLPYATSRHEATK